MTEIRNVNYHRGGWVVVVDCDFVVFESDGQRLMDAVGFSVVGRQGIPIAVIIGYVNHQMKLVCWCCHAETQSALADHSSVGQHVARKGATAEDGYCGVEGVNVHHPGIEVVVNERGVDQNTINEGANVS